MSNAGKVVRTNENRNARMEREERNDAKLVKRRLNKIQREGKPYRGKTRELSRISWRMNASFNEETNKWTPSYREFMKHQKKEG